MAATQSTPCSPTAYDVSVTTQMSPRVKAAIASIGEDAWTMIEYTDAVFDEISGQWISRAEVAEIGFVAFAAQPKADQVPGRLIVRRIPDFRRPTSTTPPGRTACSTCRRFHTFPTTADPAILDTVTAGKINRGHAIIEQVHDHLKSSALARATVPRVHAANAAWLVLAAIAFNPTPRRRHPRRADSRCLGPLAGDNGGSVHQQADPDTLSGSRHRRDA